jgi:hypothetical protein
MILRSGDTPSNQTAIPVRIKKGIQIVRKLQKESDQPCKISEKNDCRGRSLTPALIDEGSDIWSLSFWKGIN